MKRILVNIILMSAVAFAAVAQQNAAFVKEMRAEFSDIDPNLFRDASPVLKEGFMKEYNAWGAGVTAGKGSSKFVKVDGFETVVEVETHDVFYNDWDVEIGRPTDFPVFQNDCIYLTFWIRCLGARNESNEGFTRVYLQQNGDPWLKSADVNIRAGSEWVQYKIPFHAQFQNYKPKEAAVAFALGYSHQTLQIADVKVVNMGSRVSADQLPGTKFTYEGREKDAAWRKEALKNIEKNRKGDLKVVVKNKKGEIIPDAEVHVAMQNHLFAFGNIVNRPAFSNPGPNGQAYRKIVKENFNQITFENALKHDMYEQVKGEGRLDQVVTTMDTLANWGIEIRGHAGVWGSTKYTNIAKPYIEKNDIEGLRAMLRAHVKEVFTFAKGRVVDWDVLNEPYINHQFMDLLGKEEVLEWFKIAAATDPEPKLYINETRFLIDGGVNRNVQDNLYNWCKYIQDNKVKIDGLGFQGHFGETALTPPAKLLEIFNRFSELGVSLKITELDIWTADEELQADYMRDFYTLVYSYPAFEGIISWGFWERSHWRPDAAWYREDFSPKLAAEVHKDLVYKQWWTDVTGNTDTKGEYAVRAFEGKYKAIVTVGGKEYVQEFQLTNEGNTVEVIVK